ncbi:MAG: VOC family protein [Actinomycetia bacterium]|nr:VOC family protein [Actinomycetes bacterium]
MALRWYTTVIDCQDPRSLGAWWAEALQWTNVHDAEDEYVIIPSWVTPEDIRTTPWGRQGPGLVFVKVPGPKITKNRLHLDFAPHTSQDRTAEIARLKALGAHRVDVGQDADVSWTVLADPEGNEFCVLSSREM